MATKKRKPGRPKLTDGNTALLQVRLPKALLRAAEGRAKASAMTMAEYVRGLVRRDVENDDASP